MRIKIHDEVKEYGNQSYPRQTPLISLKSALGDGGKEKLLVNRTRLIQGRTISVTDFKQSFF